MLKNEVHLFDKRDERDQTITIRLSEAEKNQLKIMAGGNISGFILGLVREAHIRRLNEDIYANCTDTTDYDDGLPC